MSDQINLLIMPTDRCNMRCKYCFHGEDGYCPDVMNIDLFKKIIDSVVTKWKRIQIVWHGGEPLTVPLSFYREAYDYCKQKDIKFIFSVQTNASLLTKEYIDFFKSNSTRIGISYDGLTHDEVRGNGSIIRNNITLLNEMDINPGAILVITQKNIHHLVDEYEHFKKMNLGMKLNPMFIDGAAKDNRDEYALEVNDYCQSFAVFFKYWLKDINCNINVQTCLDFVKLILGGHASVCSYNSCVGKWFCINYKGNIYPCDRLYSEEFYLGNILDYKVFEEIYENKTFKKIILSAIERREKCKANCDIFNMCLGGCNASAQLGKGLAYADNEFCIIQKTLIKELSPIVIGALDEPKSVLNPKFCELTARLT